ncbi:MAG TPA: serine hydrolase domain-containing protein [Vicinamibacterales bacterium]|jgi:CubicO group peptidase (beta-lactamase class C family)
MLRTAIAAALAFVSLQTGGDPWTSVETLYRQRVQETGIVGSSLLFVRGGAVAHRATVGYQNAATKRPVDRDTIFHWASITKMFTGVAIMQLRDRGLLSLDDPAIKYVPELREVHNPFGDMAQVTIRHLMTHSAGLRAATWPWGGDKEWHPFEPTRWGQVVAMFPYTELLFKPGTEYRYSNPGVIVLGRIIELLSGDDYEVYIAKNLFMPLGMTHSFFDRAPYHLVDHRSHSYVRTDGGLAEQRFDFDTGITVSNGGLNASLDEMAKWVGFLIDGNDTVLKRTSLDEMFTPQIRARNGEGGSGDDVQAGLSCFIERHHGMELVGHSGDQNGFISHLYIHRPTKSGYVVSFNTDASSTADPRRTTRAVDDDLRDAIASAFWTGAPK